MLIQNETLKTLLEQKAAIVEEGKNLNVEIEIKAEPIVSKFLADKGLIEDGESEETFGKDNHYKMFKGSYTKLRQALNDNSSQFLQELIKKELEDDLNQLKAKELQVNRLNEQMSEVLKSEVIPTLELKDTEELTKIELKGIDIELTIIDMVEEYKTNYLEEKAKANAQPGAKNDNPSDLK